MSLKIGIIGLPNVGKSTLFNALTKNDALIANYPFATIEPNLGIVKLLDPRIYKLQELAQPKKTIFSTIDFLDIAGLVKGASKGDGLGNKFLENIRGVDLICLVVRCFEDKEIVMVNEKIDPIFDAEIIIWELIYADIESINTTIRKIKSNDPKLILLNKVKKHLESGQPIKTISLVEKEWLSLKNYQFLTTKNIFFLANIKDDQASQTHLANLKEYASNKKIEVLDINIHLEYEISKLPEAEQKSFIQELNLKESALNKLISFSFHNLNLQTFFTVGQEEVRSWTFKKGWTIKQCAGLIHSDLEEGFIKAKIIKYEDYIKNPNMKELQDSGKVFVEGKNYICQDGEIVKIEFKKH